MRFSRYSLKIMAGVVDFDIVCKKKSYELDVFNFLEVEIKRLVDIFNFFDVNSDLSKLNSQKKVKSSEELKFILKEAIKAYELTNGIFNVFLGKIIRDRKNDKVSSDSKLKFSKKELDSLISFEDDFIHFNSNNLQIDLGGLAKGYIVDCVLESAKKKFGRNLVSLLVNARGDMSMFSRDKPFRIGVENPFDVGGEDVSFLELKTGSIITSGHTKQFFKGGSHIVGKKSNILTISCISNKEKCYFLDILGTYFMQLDSEQVLELVDFSQRFKDVECFLILESGETLKSGFWEAYTYG